MKEELKKSISGVRGIIGDSLSPDIILSFAQAFGTLVGPGPVVIGRDTRPSGKMIEHAMVAGLQSVGCQPVLADICATPTVLILTQELGAKGGIVITASHNPQGWNGLKFVSSRGMFLNQSQADELFDIESNKAFNLVSEDAYLPVRVENNPTEQHFQRVIDYVDQEAIRAKGFKVAVDCCNGVGAVHCIPFLKDLLGCEVVPVYDNPSGIFERVAEPRPEHLGELQAAIKREGCQVGFALDPDGDRLALVDETGHPLSEEMTLVLATKQVLSHHEKGPVAINLSTTKGVEDVAEEYGCKATRTKIGEINVTEKMLELGAEIGGEGNGGVIIPKIHPCRDAYTGMAVILELMATSGMPFSESVKALPSYAMKKDKVTIRSDQVSAILSSIRQKYEKEENVTINLLDGVHMDFGDRWVHVRPSNTEPIIRVIAEAPSLKEAEELVAQLRSEI